MALVSIVKHADGLVGGHTCRLVGRQEDRQTNGEIDRLTAKESPKCQPAFSVDTKSIKMMKYVWFSIQRLAGIKDLKPYCLAVFKIKLLQHSWSGEHLI